MMRFTCERCGKRYAAPQIVPVPGRTYRLKCKGCGHLISVNGRDALRAGEGVQAAAPGASGLAAVDSTRPVAASTSTVLDTLHVPGPPAAPEAPTEHAAVPGPEGRDPFALENIVERWPPEVTGSRPLVGVPQDVSGAPPPAADGALQAPEDAPTAARHARAVLGAVEWEPEETAAPAPPRRSTRMRLAVLAVVLLACAGFLAWQYIPQRSSAPLGAVAGSPGPATPSAPQGAATSQAPPAERAAAAPAGPDTAAPAPPPAPDAGPPDAEARAPVPEAAPKPAPARNPLSPPTHPQAPAAGPASKDASKPARAESPARGPKPSATTAAPAETTTAPAATAALAPQPGPAASPARDAPADGATPPATVAQQDTAAAADPVPLERLTQEAVNRVLGAGRAAFDACLRNPARGLDQPLGARQVTLRLTVQPEGSVGSSSIDDVAVSSAQVGQCLEAAARALRFPAFKGDPVTLDQPVAIPAH